MNAVFKALIVWLMLLAVPFQGLAAASELACGAGPSLADGAGGSHAGPSTGHDQGDGLAGQPGHDGQAGSGSACCSGSMATTCMPGMAPHPGRDEAIPFKPRHVPAVCLEHPERPPRSF